MGTLYIVSTPIGNLEDITVRAIKTLFSVDVIACEDTRRSGFLLQELKKRYLSIIQTLELKKPKLISYYDEVEMQRAPELINLLVKGSDVALVSDAGTPLINDPGFILVRESLKRDIKVVSIPGPTAAIAALSVSGFPSSHFMFLGYASDKQSPREKLFSHIVSMNRFIDSTYILYCAPHKLLQILLDLQATIGNIEVVIVKELTKFHESVLKGKISQLLEQSETIQGELVLLFRLS